MQDPYKTLGVSKDAEANDIKKAFFNLAKEHHPDKGGNSYLSARVNEARDIILADRERRERNG